KGNFRIELSDSKIKVTHTDSVGNPLAIYEDDTAMKLMRKLAHKKIISEIDHALDLGAELQKAEIALNYKEFRYIQDKPLERK
ncbi:MAG: DUF4346 domain-containing protein, partial [Nanoarchaeota archaeon]